MSAVEEKIEVKALTDSLKKEVRWSTVSLSEVIGGECRLDSSYFNIDGKHAREIVKNTIWPKTNLCGQNALATGVKPERFKRILVEKSNFPILQPSQICELLPKARIFLSPATKTKLDKLRVKKGQLLVTRSGTIGNITYISRTLDNQICSDDLIRLTIMEESDVGYIYAFLKTKTGNTLIITNNYGAVVQHIEPEHLESIVIPNPDTGTKEKINNLILESFELRDQSNDLTKEAENLLISELNLPKLDSINPKYLDKKSGIRSYEIKLSKLNGRFDASYHVPIVSSILRHLNKYADEVTTLGDSRISKNIVLPGRFKRVYVEEGQGVVFFGGKQMLELDPSGKKYLSLSRHEKRINKELKIIQNTILITRSGTVGKINITPKHWEGWIANEHIIRLVPSDDSIAGYIFCWLASDYGYELITHHKYGAVVDELDTNQVSQVQIPLLKNKDSQKKINDLVLEANQKRYTAYLLEQEAIHIVNKKVLNQSNLLH